ncbi:MAG TPA: diaminopimelate decarboxylase [Solirubrobacteraceae bacterium]|jgi:diaminopimelate decarboxylase
MATGTTPSQSALSPAFPLASALNERGRVEVGGCDTIELAREYGTPAYIVAEDDLRTRAREFVDAGTRSGHADFNVVFASKSFPCTAVLRLFANEGLWCDVASAGELHLALNAGFAPERIVMHGNAKSESELRMALQAGVGLIVIDNFDEIERLARALEQFHPAHAPGGEAAHARPREEPHAAPPEGSHATLPPSAHAPTGPNQLSQKHVTAPREASRDSVQDVLIRVTPDVRGETHDHISTGQADSKFGFAMADAAEAIARIEAVPGLRLMGLHAHVGSQLLQLDPFAREVPELARLGEFPVWDLGGGLGVRYTADQPAPPAIEDYVQTLVTGVRKHGMGESGRRLLIEPGRSLVANACVTLYTVESVKRNVSRWVGVDGGMSDNLRPMLYGARYEAHVADRPGGGEECVLAGKHCESGDVIVRSALLDDPRPGDVIVTPATGAYGHAMASNYNGVPRPPVIFCSGGNARVVVRRETVEDLSARDV